MDINPCQKERDELRKAGDEWQKASDATMHYVITEPLDVSKTVPPTTRHEELKKAYDLEEEARKIYFERVQALADCHRKHKEGR